MIWLNFVYAWKIKVLIIIRYSNLFEWNYVRGAHTLSWLLCLDFMQSYAWKMKDFLHTLILPVLRESVRWTDRLCWIRSSFVHAWKTKVLIIIWYSNLFEWDHLRGALRLSWILCLKFVQSYAQKTKDLSILWYSVFEWEC